MSNETVLLFVVIALVVFALPAWPYSRSWGYAPTGILTVLLIVFLAWAIVGERPLFRGNLGRDIKAAGQDVADSVKRAVR